MSDATHLPPHEAPARGRDQLIDSPGSGRGPNRLPQNNLPLELTSFVGREREMAEVEGLLVDGARLLTLTGPGGCGKTRLALAVAFEVVGSFEDGVWWVGLASLSDPDLVPQAVAAALEIREQPNHQLADTLAEALREKKMLLVLDNCEHLIDACAALTDALLRSCPNLRVLATSREALGIAGERAWLVPSLSLADPQDLASFEELARYEAVKLFCERAKAVNPLFKLSERNAPAVARVCRRLEGMPLAIELAAARIRVLSVEQIASRLDDSFRLLKTESRTADPRQRTLRATVDWSFELLGQDEQILFRRLSVFAGGFTLEAVEEVCAGEGVEEGEVLDLLSRLVDKSLVLVGERRGEEARYRLLETIRQFGQERLEKSGEGEEVRGRHAALFLELAELAEPQLKGREQVVWLERLEGVHDNLRAAMRWLLDQGGEVEAVVRLAWALWLFWWYHGHHAEGRRFADEMLEKRDALPIDLRAKAIWVRGIMSYGLESVELMKQLFEESAALFRRVGDRSGLALALSGIGIATLQRGEMEPAAALFEEALVLFREVENKWGESNVLVDLGMVSLGRRDHERAVQYFEEGLAISREIGDRLSGYISLYNLALASRVLGEHERALQLYTEGLELAVEVGDKANTAYCLEGLATLIAERGEPERAVRLFGISEALLEAVGTPRYVQLQDRTSVENAVEALRSRLGEAAFSAAWARGRAMTPEQAVETALTEVQEELPLPTQQPTPPPPVTGPAPKPEKAPLELRISALGGARVEVGGHELTSSDFGYAKPRELLFYLLSHPPRTREQIGIALWPEASASKLRGSFHEALRRLRKALGGSRWIVHENKRYSFNRSLKGHYYFSDVEAFEEKLTEARKVKEGSASEAIRHLKEAVELYGGDFLEGFAPSVGEWALVRQEELRRSYQDALQDLGVLLFREGRYSEAAEFYRKVIAMDRYSEAAHRELMRSEAALGERGRALRHYRELVELLREELGSSPAPETVALYEGLLRGEEV